MTNELDDNFKTRLARYLAGHLGFVDTQVVSATRLTSGISRTTIKVDLVQASGFERSLIVRMDPPSSLVDSGRHVEFAIYRSLREMPGVKVPEAIANEDDAEHLGAPFLITKLLPGTTNPAHLLSTDYEITGPRIARESFEILGRIAAIDHQMLDGQRPFEVPPVCEVWRREIERWERRLSENSIGPLPATSAVLRHLRRRPPPPPPYAAVVHGDYRLGNYLFQLGGISGVLDWEMAHLGDPLEDLAWALLPNWRFGARPDRIAGFLAPEEAIAIWEQSSGLSIDRSALSWWMLLCHVKATALWVGAVHALQSCASKEIRFAKIASGSIARQEMWMLADLRRP